MTSTLIILAGCALFIVFTASVVWLVTRLVRDNRRATLATVPLSHQQTITVPPGPVVFLLEVPRLAGDARSLTVEVLDRGSGRKSTLSHSYLTPRAKISGVSTVKIPYGQVDVAAPGELLVRVAGLEATRDYSAYRLVLSRPFGARLALQISGIVFCGVGMLLCGLWICWLAGLLSSVKG